MSDRSTKQTTDTDDFERGFQVACSAVVVAARSLRSRLLANDMEAAREFGRVVGVEMAKAGATEDEARHYGQQIFLSVMTEHQA